MKVYELMALLWKCNLDDIVVMSKDGEGNSFSPLSDISKASYEADTTWSGDIGLRKLTDEDREQGYTEEDVGQGEDCVVLWPTN